MSNVCRICMCELPENMDYCPCCRQELDRDAERENYIDKYGSDEDDYGFDE